MVSPVVLSNWTLTRMRSLDNCRLPARTLSTLRWRAASSGSLSLTKHRLSRQSFGPDQVAQAPALYKLHRDVGFSSRLTGIVNSADVGMVQAGSGSGLPQ